MNKSDRRVRRTKKLLKDSLAQLLYKKELRDISVKELTELADISRGAFYTHYQDIYDLYEQMENELLEKISAILVSNPSRSYHNEFRALLDYVYDNAAICKTFMGKNAYGRFREKLSDFMEQKFRAIVLYEMEVSEMKEEWNLIVRYQNDGFISMLSLWLETDLAYPKEDLLKLVINIDDALDPLFV